MLFALICTDKPGHLQVRKETRPDHVAFLDGLNDDGRLVFAGPFLGDDENPNGTLCVVNAESPAEARLIADKDPYAMAGLFSSVEIRPWNWVFNKPEAA